MCDIYIYSEKGIVTEAGNRGDDGYGDATKAEYCSRIHTSVLDD